MTEKGKKFTEEERKALKKQLEVVGKRGTGEEKDITDEELERMANANPAIIAAREAFDKSRKKSDKQFEEESGENIWQKLSGLLGRREKEEKDEKKED